MAGVARARHFWRRPSLVWKKRFLFFFSRRAFSQSDYSGVNAPPLVSECKFPFKWVGTRRVSATHFVFLLRVVWKMSISPQNVNKVLRYAPSLAFLSISAGKHEDVGAAGGAGTSHTCVMSSSSAGHVQVNISVCSLIVHPPTSKVRTAALPHIPESHAFCCLRLHFAELRGEILCKF